MEEIYESITKYKDLTCQSGFFFSNRREQSLYWMHENIERQLVDGFYNDPIISQELDKIRKDVTGGKISGYKSARRLLKKYLKTPE
jgi:LAO/AO transport system kinase